MTLVLFDKRGEGVKEQHLAPGVHLGRILAGSHVIRLFSATHLFYLVFMVLYVFVFTICTFY